MPVLLRSRPTGVDGACLCHAFGFGVKKMLLSIFCRHWLRVFCCRSFDWQTKDRLIGECLLFFVVLGLVFSIPSQEIVFGKPLQNELFCVEWGVKPQLNYPAGCKYNEYIYLFE